MTSLAPFAPLLPEIVLAVGAMVLLVIGVFRPETDVEGERAGWLAILLLGVAGALLLAEPSGTRTAFGGAFIVDGFARFMKLLVLAGSAGALLLSLDDLKDHKILRFEYPVLILLATVGMLMMVSAGDLIALYVGLELQSLALYVVAAWRRDDVRSSEAGLKYFVLGALSSGMLLYGASLVYGFTGTTSFTGIATVATSGALLANTGLLFGLVFLIVGIAFKISAVPFHMWTPDVYEGAPTPVTAFFSAAPKIAAMALFVRVLAGAFPASVGQWQQIVIFLAIASMGLGAFAAIGQRNIKRLMAYSSIANVGFALVGLAAGSEDGVRGVLIYMAIYLVMTLGAFGCILAMRRDGRSLEDLEELSGLASTNLPLAFVLAMLMFSLAGIPPLAGFFAKFYVFLAAVRADLWPLAVTGVVLSVVGAYYYLRIVKIMFFDPARPAFSALRTKEGIVIGLAGLFVVLFTIYPAPMIEAATVAARTFRL